MRPTCETCKYWEPVDKLTNICRRYPPQVTVKVYSDRDGEVTYKVDTESPWTGPEDWCGEYTQKKS
jgi:hypothetical protein